MGIAAAVRPNELLPSGGVRHKLQITAVEGGKCYDRDVSTGEWIRDS